MLGAAAQIGTEPPDLVIVDHPRTAVSPDAARFIAAGCLGGTPAAFDLVPQTPPVETVPGSERGQARGPAKDEERVS